MAKLVLEPLRVIGPDVFDLVTALPGRSRGVFRVAGRFARLNFGVLRQAGQKPTHLRAVRAMQVEGFPGLEFDVLVAIRSLGRQAADQFGPECLQVIRRMALMIRKALYCMVEWSIALKFHIRRASMISTKNATNRILRVTVSSSSSRLSGARIRGYCK